MSGGFTASGGGYAFPQISGGGGGGVGGEVGERPFRDVINVASSTYGADPSRDDNYDSFAAALEAARNYWVNDARKVPIYIPGHDDVYTIQLSHGFVEGAVDGGTFVIDWPLEIYGDGPRASRVSVVGPILPYGTRASLSDATVPLGVVSAISFSPAQITLATPANTANFKVGDYVSFADNADGTSPRYFDPGADPRNPILASTILSNATTTGIISVSSLAYYNYDDGIAPPSNPPQVGDFVFAPGKLQFTEPGAAAQFAAGGGIRVSASATANPDGSDFRATLDGQPVKIHSVNTALNYIVIDMSNTITGFVDGDYIYYFPFSSLFVHQPSEDEATDFTLRDVGFVGQYHGFAGYSGNVGDIGTRVFTSAPTDEPERYAVTFENVTATEFSSVCAVSAGANLVPHFLFSFRRCDFSVGTALIGIFTTEMTFPDATVEIDNCYLHDSQSHLAYVHSNISLRANGNRFDEVANGREALDHWGLSHAAKFVSVTNNWFGSGITGRAFMTGQLGSFYFAGNTVECNQGVAVRCTGSIVGNTFRPSGLSPSCILQYFLCAWNSHVRVIGNHFDFAQVDTSAPNVANGIHMAIPAHWIISGNSFTANIDTGGDYTSTAGPVALPNTTVHCVLFQNGAISTSFGAYVEPTTVIMTDNHAYFETATASFQSMLINAESPCDLLSIRNNRYVGRAAADQSAIKVLNGMAVSGKVEIEGNQIDETRGHGIRLAGAWGAAAPKVSIRRNDVITRTATKNAIVLDYSAGTAGTPTATTFPIELSDNTLASDSVAILIGANVGAGTVRGSGNTMGADTITTTNAQQLRPPRVSYATVITAAASISISPDYDTFLLDDAGATDTIDTIRFGGADDDQSCFDGAQITLIFTTANVSISAAGNVAVASGPHAAGEKRQLTWAATLSKWV